MPLKYSSCEYSAEVSGGADRGFFAATQTISCIDCTKLYDLGLGKIGGTSSAVGSKRLSAPQVPNPNSIR
jgi:hypothetical protein